MADKTGITVNDFGTQAAFFIDGAVDVVLMLQQILVMFEGDLAGFAVEVEIVVDDVVGKVGRDAPALPSPHPRIVGPRHVIDQVPFAAQPAKADQTGGHGEVVVGHLVFLNDVGNDDTFGNDDTVQTLYKGLEGTVKCLISG